MTEPYHKALRRERDREDQWREKTRQGRFESGFRPLDSLAQKLGGDIDHSAAVSDGGAAVEQLVDALDAPTRPTRQQLIRRAAKCVKRKCPECLSTFWAVIRNGTNWRESVWELLMERQGRKDMAGTSKETSTVDASKKS